MEKKTLKTMLVIYGAGMFCTACGYLAGHTAAMHQHGSEEEVNELILTNDGKISYIKYIKAAFSDYIKMIRDPYKTLN